MGVNKLITLLFPPKCMLCRCVCEDELCARCAAGGQWTRTSLDSTACVAAVSYEGAWRDALLAFKFRGRRGLARPLGALITQTVQTAWPEAMPDVVTWVPVSHERLRERGYDQARLLAKVVARRLDRPLLPALRKVKHTEAQSGLSTAQARRENVAGTYQLLPRLSFSGQRVLVIDDIVTTGATLSQALDALRPSGGVYACAVVARTDSTPLPGSRAEKGSEDTTYSK